MCHFHLFLLFDGFNLESAGEQGENKKRDISVNSILDTGHKENLFVQCHRI